MVKIQVDSLGKAIMLGNKALEATGGGEPTDGDYLVQVIDYDGTVLKSARLNTGAIFTLPNTPSHSGLVFDEWSSPVTITNNTVTVTNSDITIGAVFHTASGLSEFDITLTKTTGLSVTLNMDGTKNWGDGTTDTSTTHTYASTGDYTITCDGRAMQISSNIGLFGQNASTRNYYIKNVRLGSNISLQPFVGHYAFWYCSSLASITIPKGNNFIGVSSFAYSSLPSITLPNNYDIGESAFSNCYSLESIAVGTPRLSSSGIQNSAFNGCMSLTSVTIPEGTKYLNSRSLMSCFSLTKITLPSSLESIGSYALSNCRSIKSITIPESVTIINDYTFQYCYTIEEVIMPEGITSIGTMAFESCESIKSIKIPKYISSIGNDAFRNCHSIIEYDFSDCTSVPALSNPPFSGINGICKIYVPWDLYQEWITTTNWSTYVNYIDGGTPSTLNFTVIPNNSLIYVKGSQIQGTSTSWVGSTAPYIIHDSTNNVILSRQQTGIAEGAIVNITADLTSYNKITLATGVTGLTATATIDGLTFPMTEEASGNYSINVVGSGTVIDYFIDGGSNYMDASGSVTTTGSDITEAVTLTPAVESTFTRPNLTADGTLGGSSFAVKDVGAGTSATTYAWRAVDSSTTTYWNGNTPFSGNKTYIFYNPDALKVSELTYTYGSTSYRATAVSIEGSNDNLTWETITSTYSGSSTTYTSTLTNNKSYKYYKLTFTPDSYYVRIYDLAITATYKAPAS